MFTVIVFCVEADTSTAELIRLTYGDLSERVSISRLDRDRFRLPELDGRLQSGTCVFVVSAQFIRQWFGGAPWAEPLLRWRTDGGCALVLHPDASAGPFDWPALELAHVRAHAREHSIAEFLDVPRPLTLRYDAADEDDGHGALEHARGTSAWLAGQIPEAADHFERALRARLHLHAGDPRVAASENALGASLLRTGNIIGAVRHLETAVLLRRTWLGHWSPQAAVSANNLGIALLNAGEAPRASVELMDAARAMIDLGPSYSEAARGCALHLAAALRAVADLAGADSWQRRADALLRSGASGPKRDVLLN